MNISSFRAALDQHSTLPVRFALPDGETIPAEFHVTEVGHVAKTFIDCGGTIRRQESCLLQAWVADNDHAHRLTAGKLSGILGKARRILPANDLAVEVEYGTDVVAQYTVGEPVVSEGQLRFALQNKHTDCLARESCGVSPASTGCSCESEGSTCCR